MASSVSDGKYIDHTPGSAVAAGEVVVIGSIVGVATRPIASGELGAVAIEGVFTFSKDSSDISAGDAVNYFAGDDEVTTASTGVAAGYAIADAGTSATTVNVKLDR